MAVPPCTSAMDATMVEAESEAVVGRAFVEPLEWLEDAFACSMR